MRVLDFPRARSVLDTVKALPGGLRAPEVADLMTDLPRPTTFNTIQLLCDWGCLSSEVVRGPTGGRPERVVTFAKPIEERAPSRRRGSPATAAPSGPSDAALTQRIAELEAEVRDLRAWKSEAEERFPDLKVPEIVLRARKIVAGTLEDGGDREHAKAVLSGSKDTSPMMRAVLAALETT